MLAPQSLRARSRLFTAACAWLALGACSAISERPHADAGRREDAGAHDAGRGDGGQRDGGARDAGKPSAVPTTITLDNTGSAPFVVGNQCGGTFLTLSHAGENLAYDLSCSRECGTDVGGCPAICLFTQQLVVPGKSASMQWDGRYGRFDDSGCYELAGLQRGDVVTAQACWNETPNGPPPQCQTTDFLYDQQREVTIRAEHHSAARTPVSIVLENRTGGPIELVTDSCGAQQWFALALKDEPGASLSTFCPCSCNADFAIDPGSCPGCGACADPVLQTLDDGALLTLQWDGMFWFAYDSGCSEQYAMPAGFMVNAQVCFKRPGATTRTCQPTSFTLGESAEVRVTVQ